jgi:NAD(P)H-hydrate repair Nnr-like enzyme with NAD(P)H-hydrate dehydratase domain
VIATPAGDLLHYPGGGGGLATAGSGDVLSGVIGGLLARGADPLLATAWGVWLHGEAGRACASKVAPIGFLARDLLTKLPALLAR